LLALLNAPVVDYTLRTFLGSRMQIEIGDIRRLPVPILADRDADRLTDLGRRALAAKRALDRHEGGTELPEIEAELDACVRRLYGIPRDAELWVVR
jgi:hypothetical protein